jgi:hypothetical protein
MVALRSSIEVVMSCWNLVGFRFGARADQNSGEKKFLTPLIVPIVMRLLYGYYEWLIWLQQRTRRTTPNCQDGRIVFYCRNRVVSYNLVSPPLLYWLI